MLQSMTGYGKSESFINNKKILVEVKSLNSKFIDVNLKLSSIYKSKELEIRSMVAKLLLRGKVEISIFANNINTKSKVSFNKALMKDYYDSLLDAAQENDIVNIDKVDFLSHIMRLPDIITSEIEDTDVNELDEIISLVNTACKGLIDFRKNEGKILQNDILSSVENIKTLLAKVELHEQDRVDKISTRIRSNIEKHLQEDNFDENRFQQELIYFIEKLDISEEKVRLAKHCSHFIETTTLEGVHGKKLGFISQEIGREINTLGAKANHSEIQKIVVDMKDNLEKIKEQLLNIL
jgi:uncharacterized protein (TIGR00255 family)